MRKTIIAMCLSLVLAPAVNAQVSVGIDVPGVSIGIDVPTYPQLVLVPNYPVYYAPGLDTNMFFYDGLYWNYDGTNWYSGSWYNGPWNTVDPMGVPLFVLRVPVSYYRQPPAFFAGWEAGAPPRWDDHWGGAWSSQHQGWATWNRNSVPSPAPLPTYQSKYSGSSYPQPSQQRTLLTQNYKYQPHDAMVRQQFQKQATPVKAAAAAPRSPVANAKAAEKSATPSKSAATRESAPREEPQRSSAATPSERPAPAIAHNAQPVRAPVEAKKPAAESAASPPRPQASEEEKRPPVRVAAAHPVAKTEPSSRAVSPASHEAPPAAHEEAPKSQPRSEPQSESKPAARSDEHDK
jgi:hypothetical protein